MAEDGHSDSGQCGRRMDEEKHGYPLGLMWADNFGIMSHSKENMERMLRVLIEEASRWDLEPKPASLWWTSTHDAEEKVDMILGTTAGCHNFPFEEKFNILGYAWHSDIQKRRCSVEGEVPKTG